MRLKFILALMGAVSCTAAERSNVIIMMTDDSGNSGLETRFLTPPDEAKPWVWYRWSGHVTKEGLRADMKALGDQGFGGFVVDFSDGAPLVKAGIPGNMDFGGEEFFDHVFYMLTEAHRHGLKVSLSPFNGWAAQGGEWVHPEHREHMLVWDEAVVKGAGQKTLTLTPPLAEGTFYCDIATIAFPVEAPAETAFRKAAPRVSADTFSPDTQEGKWNRDSRMVVDGNPGSFATLQKPVNGNKPSITFTFDEPFAADAIYLHPGASYFRNLVGAEFNLQVSDDGQSFRDLHSFKTQPLLKGRSGVTIPLPSSAAAKVWRLQLTRADWPHHAWIAEVELLRAGEKPSTLPRIPYGDSYAGGTLQEARFALDRTWKPSESAIVQNGKMINLTNRLQPDGSLKWDAPEGDWVVARVGYTESGKTTSAITRFGSKGPQWEINKFSREAAEVFLSGIFDKLVSDPRAKPLLGTTLTGMHLDSWECTLHLWSDAIPAAWEERMPYPLEPWMPALLGFTVSSPEDTRRFLWDFRRFRADLIGDHNYRTMQDRARAAGMTFDAEFSHLDRMKSFQYVDIPTTEFSPRGDWGGAGRLKEGIQSGLKMTASAGHVYGCPVISSEAFLAWEKTFQPDHLTPVLEGGDDGKRKFDRDPRALKSSFDKAFAQGVNRLMFHLFMHQPFSDKLPGLTTTYGTNFGRDMIWWKFAHGWTDYLSRCQLMLQQGVPQTDFLFCMSEDAYSFGSVTRIENAPYMYDLKSGYDFDYCTGQMLISRCLAEDGQIVLPTGQRYSLLVVGDLREMTYPLMEKIAKLVEQGVPVLAAPPKASPALADKVAGNDPEFQKLKRELWGDINGKSIKENRYGKGTVLWGYSAGEALRKMNIAPAMTYVSSQKDAKIEFMQRRAGSDDIFFISSQNDEPVAVDCSFLNSGKIPELWFPDTGKIEGVPNAREENGRTVIPFKFGPNESVFVVFRDAPSATRSAAGPLVKVSEVAGPWQVSFTSPFDETSKKTYPVLESWTKSDDRFIQYFSGTAVYTTEFSVNSKLRTPNSKLLLDLGEVWNLAQVTVNGKTFDPLWNPPFRVDITDAVKKGRNDLKIEVVNTWVNRLIGDLNLPEAERKSWISINPHTAQSPLRPAGLLGPVELFVAN